MNLQAAFQLSIAAVAFWGFTALLQTGEFHWLEILPCYAVVVFSFMSRRFLARTPMAFWNMVTVLVFGGMLYVAFDSLLNAAVYFFMALQLIKLLTMRRSRDAVSVYVIAFFQVLGASVLTTSMTFSLTFAGFILLTAMSLMLFSMVHAAEHVQVETRRLNAVAPSLQVLQPEPSREPPAAHHIWPGNRGFVAVTAVITLVVFTVSLAFFLLIPRFSTQRLFKSLGGHVERNSVSAFDENIEFGAFDKIQLDNSIALYVRPMDQERPSHIRLRGTALDRFDGRSWRRTTHATDFQPFGYMSRRAAPVRRNMMIQPPGVTNFLFGETFPETLRLEFDQAVQYDPLSGSGWLPQIPAKEFHYTVTSRVDDVSLREDPATFNQVRRPTRDQPVGQTSAPIERIREFGERVVASLGTAGATERPLPRPGAEEPDTDNRSRGSGGGAFIERFRQPTYYAAKCLQLPATIDREAIAELSREVAANATTPFEQCRAIESYLRTNYEYSLEQKRPTEGNFVSNFLFRTKKGHCEYFATSMVMMLRVLGIPSRIVNGYYCAEWNNIGNLFTVRQRDAHSWVEAHFDNYGWMTFDPTPPTGVGRLPDTNPILLAIGRSFDAMKIRWYRYMIDFNLRDQLVIARGFLNLTRWLGDSLGTFRVSWISDEVQASPRDVGSLFAAIAITAAGVAGAVALWRSRLVRWTRRVVRQKSLVRKIAPFYEEIVRLLERHGFIRSLTETPREFAARVSVDANLYQFAEITEVYYHHKYGGHGLAEHHLRAAREFAIHLRARK